MKKRLEKFYTLVESLESLPGLGKKSAMRYALDMVLNNRHKALKIATAIENAISIIKRCKLCGNLSEDEVCYICSDESRDRSKLCIVESIKDIFVIEDSKEFDGRYFVLENIEEETISKLKELIKDGIKEVLFAFSPSIATDSMIVFVEDKLKDFNLEFYKIAQGVPTGVSLENVDLLSLSRALISKTKV